MKKPGLICPSCGNEDISSGDKFFDGWFSDSLSCKECGVRLETEPRSLLAYAPFVSLLMVVIIIDQSTSFLFRLFVGGGCVILGCLLFAWWVPLQEVTSENESGNLQEDLTSKMSKQITHSLVRLFGVYLLIIAAIGAANLAVITQAVQGTPGSPTSESPTLYLEATPLVINLIAGLLILRCSKLFTGFIVRKIG